MMGILSRLFSKKTPAIVRHLPIAGLQYYRAAELSELMHQGDELNLEHEAENPHDPNAVMVLWHQNKIGYIPSDYAGELSALIAEHPHICAKIVEITPEKGESRWVKLSVYPKV